MYAAGKTAHKMDADIANLCLVKRSGNARRRDLGRIECAAVILDPGDQRFVHAIELDCNFQATVFRDAIHDNIGDRLFETKLNSKRKIG
jgi:hypothetical protein